MLLYRCLLSDVLDMDTLRVLLGMGAIVRGTQGGIHGLAFRQYCYRFLLDAEARESLKTPFSPRGGANRAAGAHALVHCATFWLGAGVGRCTWLSRQATVDGQPQMQVCTHLKTTSIKMFNRAISPTTRHTRWRAAHYWSPCT